MPASRSGKSAASRTRPRVVTKKEATPPKPSAARGRPTGTGTPHATTARAGTTRGTRTVPTAPGPDGPLTDSNIMAFVATTDAARARAFYETVLGLRFIAEDPFALVFDANGIMIRIQKVEVVTPPAYTALGWTVVDIAATIRRLGANGVHCERYDGLEQGALGVWTSPSGARIAWFKDPDGHVLSLTQW